MPRARASPAQIRRGHPSLKSETGLEFTFIASYLDPVIQAAVARRDPALAEALLGYVRRELAPRQQLPLLARLLTLGVVSARPVLMRLATAARAQGDERLAGEALARALAPVERPVFTQPEEEEVPSSLPLFD